MQHYSLVSHFIKSREFTMAPLQVEKWLLMNARVCQVRGREQNHWTALSHSSSAGVNSCSASPIHFGCLRKNHWLFHLAALKQLFTLQPAPQNSPFHNTCSCAMKPYHLRPSKDMLSAGVGHWNMFWPRLEVGRDVYFPGDTYLL